MIAEAERKFRVAQACVAAMPVPERSNAVWRGMRRLADSDASGVVVVAYFAICARLQAEGVARARLHEIASAIGCALNQLDDLLLELVRRRAVFVLDVDDEGIVTAVPVFEERVSPHALH